MRIRPEDLKVYRIVSSPEEALEAIKDFEKIIKLKSHRSEEEKAFEL